MSDSTLTPFERVFLLRKASRKVVDREAYGEEMDQLCSMELVVKKRNFWGQRVWKLTQKGRIELERVKRASNSERRLIAQGYADHLSYGLFQQIVEVDGLKQYLDGQRNLESLMALHWWYLR
jgi:hypothetical protein